MMEARLDELRRSVALGCRVLASQGHGDLVWGHVSTRDPGGAGVWIKRAGVGFDEVGPEDTILVTPEGDVGRGEGRRHHQ
jgi:L-fuculose-phosphate aldolase